MSNSNYQIDNFYSNSRLSSLFTPIKDCKNNVRYQMNEAINSKMILNGIQLNKIGTFGPSELAQHPNPQSTDNQQCLNSNSCFTPLNLSFIQNNSLGTQPALYNSNALYNSFLGKIPSYNENSVTNFNNSIINQGNEISQIKPFDISLEENSKDLFCLMGMKRQKFITKEIKESNEYTIEANKMTKKLLDENQTSGERLSMTLANSLHWNNSINISNSNVNSNTPISTTAKVKKHIHLSFEDHHTSNIIYQYLLENFEGKKEDSFDFNNLKLINKYKNSTKLQQQLNPNQHDELVFGENPLNKFNDWLTWLNQEQEKDSTEQSKQLCDDILKTLNSISGFMSTLPILVCPNQQRTSSFDLLRKQSKKKKEFGMDSKEGQKLFCCELCFEPFKTGQGLGGHMSRKHKDQSMKFKRKKEIRTKREPIRNILLKAKEQLCKDNCVDFEEKMKTKQGKKYIKWLIMEHNEDYKRIRNDLKRSYFSNKKHL